jgi:3-(3-hydroxy-phenyl)propionate hydroxylase
MLLPQDRLSDAVTNEELWNLLARWIRPGEAELWRAASYRFHGLVAERWRRGRVLLAGDAAHMTPPFMAQGMVAGIRDAHNLAWKLDRVLGGTSQDSLLDTYGLERRPHAEALIALAIELGKVICERDPVAARRRDAAMLESHGGSVKTRIRQSMLPSLKAGLVVSDTAGAGELFPQPHVASREGAPVLLDRLSGATLRVFALPGLSAEEATQLAHRVAALPGRLVCIEPGATGRPNEGVLRVSEDAPLVSGWLEYRGARFAIVRPDHYVYGTAARLEDLGRLLDRLEEGLRDSRW